MYTCKVCGKIFEKRKSLVNHIVRGSNPHYSTFEEYCEKHDHSLFYSCSVCGSRTGCTSIFLKNNPLCKNKNCRRFKNMLGKYKPSNDPFNIKNPKYWLNFYNKDSNKTVKHLKYLKYFSKYISNLKLSTLLESNNLGYEFTKFIDRLKNMSIDIDTVKKFPANSVNRWISLGFNKEVSKIISLNFTTTKQIFIDRHGIGKWNKYSYKLSSADRSNMISYFSRLYWKNKGLNEIEINSKLKEICTRDLDYFIKKYGKIKGQYKYDSMINKRKYKFSLQGNIDLYGLENGTKRYYDIIQKKTSFIQNIKSKQSLDFICEISKHITYNGNVLDEYPLSGFFCDFFFDNIGLVVEYYGDYWHKNYLMNHMYTKNDISIHKSAHIHRTNELLSNPNVHKIIIVWESSFVHDRDNTISKFIEFMMDDKIKYCELNYNTKTQQRVDVKEFKS